VRYYNSARFNISKDSYVAEMFRFTKKKTRTVVLNFPLYVGVRYVLVGIDEDAVIERSDFLKPGKKNVFYGTSITQGGFASRPGMAYTNILSRLLKEECVNLGFSANGKGDAIVAECMAQMGATCFILDYVANCSVELYKETLLTFIRILKNKKPHVPVFVVLVLRRSLQYFLDDLEITQDPKDELGDFIPETINQMKKEGHSQIYFIDSSKLLGEDFEEKTVDGLHPTDLGFYYIAKNLYGILRQYK
jgi:hypothetical protein